MTIEEQIDHWMKAAELDLPVAEHLFKNGYNVWCLFIGHLVLEKILKAHYVNVPEKLHLRFTIWLN